MQAKRLGIAHNMLLLLITTTTTTTTTTIALIWLPVDCKMTLWRKCNSAARNVYLMQ